MASTARKDGTAPDISEINVFCKTHEYKGATLLALQSPEIIESLETFQTRSDDVFTVCFPKAGSHWIWEIVSLIVNDVDIEKIDHSRITYFLDFALPHNVDDVETITPSYETISKWESPRVIPTHILEEFCPEHIKKRSKVIYFCRNPKDVCVSYFKFLGSTLPEEMEGWKGFLPFFLSDKILLVKGQETCVGSTAGSTASHTDRLRESTAMYHGGWFRHVKGWWALKDEVNIHFCKYEDFNKDLRGSIKRLADFLECPLSDEKLDKMVELTEMKGMQKTYQQIEETMAGEGQLITKLFGKYPYLRKGKVGGWKDEFTVAENQYFDKIYEERMDGSGIGIQFEL